MDKSEARHKAQTDLYFLAKQVLGYSLVERVHRPVCDLFVHKDPSKTIAEQDTVKERLLLDPRGHFKTTIDIADTIQWVLVAPDVRVSLLTGSLDLASRMMWEVQSHFQNNEVLRDLFPEHAVHPKKKLAMSEFLTPGRTAAAAHLREPSVYIATTDSTKAGSHPDVQKVDDAVHENNIGTPEQLQKTIDSVSHTIPLVEPYGYTDYIGTRYDYSDLYGFTLDNLPDTTTVVEEIDFGKLIYAPKFRGFIRRVWNEIKNEKGDVTDYELLFPERFTVEWLLEIKRKFPYLFNCQYLNDPNPLERQSFTEELLVGRTIPRIQVPRTGRLFQFWDLGFSQNQFADWSVCATGLFDGSGRLFILDIDMGRYSSHELVMRIIGNNMLWRPQRIGIDASSGATLLQPGLEMMGRSMGQILPIDWYKLKNTKGAKEERISALHTLLLKEQMFFVADTSNLDEVFKQFKRFPKYKFNDGPDAIALLVEKYRDMIDITPWRGAPIEVVGSRTYGDGMLGSGIIG